MKTVINAPAKINLYLDVLWKRPDGFHNIQSIMQTVSLCDQVTLHIENSVNNSITVKTTNPSIPSGRDNIAYRAAENYLSNCGITGKSIDIFIEKRIPVCAGLAGGSADAAAVLLGLEKAFGSRAGMLKILELAEELGADVPFCVVRGTKVTQSKGESMYSLPRLPDCSVLIAVEDEAVSTAWAYGELDRIHDNYKVRRDDRALVRSVISGLEGGDLDAVTSGMFNIFEEVVFPSCPKALFLKNELLRLGALGALLCGSGAAVFGIFRSRDEANEAKLLLEAPGRQLFLCRPE